MKTRVRQTMTVAVLLDWGPAVGGALFTAVAVAASDVGGLPWVNLACQVAYFFGIGFRRRAPVAAHAVVVLGAILEGLSTPAGGGTFTAFLALMLTNNALAAGVASRWMVGAALVSTCGYNLALLVHNGPRDAWEFGPVIVWSVVAAVLGRAFRNRSLLVHLLEDRATRLERQREEDARRAVTEERARIARELHDIVAHSLSVMVVQAGGGTADDGQRS
jgi:signal transduction histidine kinase